MRTPTRRLFEASRASPSASKRASDRITSPVSGIASSSATETKVLSAQRAPPLTSSISLGIDSLLEGLEAEAPIGVEEALAVGPDGEIGADQLVNGGGDLVGRQGRTQDLADRGVFRARAAQRQLVEFLALLIDAQDADVGHVVVAAGVDAAADLDLQLADLLGAIQIGELAGDVLGDRDRAGVG